jgi:hypothetical protein
MTKERDELVQLLATSQTSEATLSDALQNMTDKATEMKEELSEAQQKIKDDEEAINMLRSKVEESRYVSSKCLSFSLDLTNAMNRRGLMRLQTENRRQSMQPIDISRASMAGMASISTAPSSMASKRASFTPLTGQTISLPPDTASPPPKSRHARRISDIFSVGAIGSSPPLTTPDINPELESLRKELASAKEALEETRNELSESHEARDASDTCVAALRAFIDENNVGINPPQPARTSTESASSSSSKPAATSWGFNKLWKVDTTTPKATTTISEATPTGPAPSKFSGLFSSRTQSVSTVPTTNSRPSSARSDSDVSSVAEPVSPSHGTDEANRNVVVRELSDTSSTFSSGVEAVSDQKVRM